MQPSPRSYDLVPIPSVSGSWRQFISFAHTYNPYTHLCGDVETLRQIAYEPVARTMARGGAGPSERVGIDILRAALFYLARADRFAGETDFGSPDEERLYRAIVAELHQRSDGLLPWCGDAPVPPPVDALDHRFRVLVRPFAEAIRAKGNALSHTEMTKKQAARLRESMLDDLKKCSDVTIPAARAVRVSAAAAAQAAGRGVDLHAQTWHTQPKFDPGRLTFHWEHTTPLAQLLDECLAVVSVAGVLDLLAAHLGVAWITKEEDRLLTKRGFKSRRPDPEVAYREAGIVLLPIPPEHDRG